MLKSTHRAIAQSPLPSGWTEHKAPTGHSYFYNAESKESTYTRPVAPLPLAAPGPADPAQSFLQHQSIRNPSLDTSKLWFTPSNVSDSIELQHQRRGRDGHRGDRPKPQPTDKPKSRQSIPGCEPWVLVHTKYGRRFVYNTEKTQSFWRIPEKLKDGILALDQQRIREKAEALTGPKADSRIDGDMTEVALVDGLDKSVEDAESSEYEEVEVTDDEDENAEDNPSKRRRTEDPQEDEPLEFDEDDIAYQLAAMGQDYGLDPGEYEDGDVEWEGEIEELSADDSAALFKDLLNDVGVNPYSPWEKLVDEGKLVDDTRYTALATMRARKEVWEGWSREKIKQLKEARAKEEKKDPRIPYLSLLHKHATPKLYWPEFKRKYRKEPEMRDIAMADKEREKLYREHINRLKLPQATLKSELSTLLKDQPLSGLNSSTPPANLPSAILTDIRYVSLVATTRDPLIETFISTLPPAPKSIVDGRGREESVKQQQDRERRQKALEDRGKRVAEEKRRHERDLRAGKDTLRQEEEEIARAMRVDKRGLKHHLLVEEDRSVH